MGMPGDFDKLKDKDKVDILQQRIQFQNETIENQKTTVAEHKKGNAELREQLEKLSNSIQTQTGVIAEQQGTLKDQESTILQQHMSISELQKQLISLQKNLESVNTQLAGLGEKNRGKTDSLEAEIRVLKKALDDTQIDFNQKITEREELIKTLRDENANLETGVKELTKLKLTITEGDSSSLERRILDMETTLKEADSSIASSENELTQLKQKMQEEIEIREAKIGEYERLLTTKGIEVPKARNFVSDRETAAKTISAIFSRIKSNVMIFLPDIRVLDSLNFETLRSIIRVKLAVPAQKNPQLIDQLKVKSNIEIRDYTGGIWGILRDNDEMLLAPIGEKNEPSGLILKGEAQIDTFGTILRSTWARLKRV